MWNKKNILHIRLILIFLLNTIVFIGNAQYPGSLMMLQDNFYSQIMNPAYMRTDQAITLAVPGLSGLSLKNAGSFKISDVIYVNENGNPELDIERFYNISRPKNYNSTNISVPIVFISTPTDKGVFTFFYQERMKMLTSFSSALTEYFYNGNIMPEYRTFSSEEINSVALGVSDFTFGYAQKLDDKFTVGLRGKILFGNLFISAENWEYGVKTSESGDKMTLTSKGSGQMSFPVPVYLGYNDQVYYIDGSNAARNYLTKFKNPGLAFDFGLNWKINSIGTMSFVIRDLGAIWFKNNGLNLTLNSSYDFVGFDLENAVRYLEPGYTVNPLRSLMETKEEIRDVYRPIGDTARFVKTIAPQTVVHYHLKSSEKLEFGITNQTIFQKNLLYNALTFTALQKTANFSFFESINVHQLSSLSFGGGFQYTGKTIQLFLAADNLIAFYHPADNKTFSVTFGMSFLFNHQKDEGSTNGRFLPHLPFYRIQD